MNICNLSATTFLRTLLEQCVGTVMIEAEHWDFSAPIFQRGYFNDRIKHQNAINHLTHERLNFVFAHLFQPQSPNSRFQEPQAVEAANHLIALFQQLFQVDCSLWTNTHTADNSIARSHLLACLDNVLSLSEDEISLPTETIHNSLLRYLEQVQSHTTIPANEYPTFLSAAPCGATEYFIGRAELIAAVISTLLAEKSVCLCGIGGIGKTEIAKAVLKQLSQKPVMDTGIRYLLWVNDMQQNFAQALLQALNIDTNTSNLQAAFQKALQNIQQFHSQLLLIIDHVESDTDAGLRQVTEYLDCRILITSRMDSFPHLTKLFVPPLSLEHCLQLFYHYYHGAHDDTALQKIIALADRHTAALELLAKIADTEEAILSEFLEQLIRCGFQISEEEACTSHEQLCSEGKIIEQLQKIFCVYGCTTEEMALLVQIAAIPAQPFYFEQAKKWFGIANRTTLNRLAKQGWIKKEIQYETGHHRYHYVIHSIIASAVRAQYQEQLYQACQNFIYDITIEMQQQFSKTEAFRANLIQFSWALHDIFGEQLPYDILQKETSCDFLWSVAELYGAIGYYEQALPLLDTLKSICKTFYDERYAQWCFV